MSDATTSADAGNVADATTTAEAAAATTAQTTTSQTSEASWRDSLPEDIKSAPTLSKFETIEGLAKSYVNLEKMMGAEKVAIPKEGDQAGWDKFYATIGRPENPDGYEFKTPEQPPEGLVYDAEMDKQLAGVFHKHGLSKAQAAGLRQDIIDEFLAKGAMTSLEASKKAEIERNAAIQQAETALKQEWGTAYEQRGKIAGAAINTFLSPETVAAMDAAGLANNPAIIKDMYNLGVKLAGEKSLIGEGAELDSPADLDKQIADLRQKHGAALYDKAHPDHVQRTKELTALFERRYPEQKQ